MKFRRLLGFSLVLTLGMISAGGQTVRSTTDGITYSSTISGGIMGATHYSCFDGNCVGGATFNPWAETRKPIVPMPTIASVLKSAKLVSLEGQPDQHYLRAAKAIKFESPATDEAELLEAIQTHGLPLYDSKKVDEYLYNQALHMKAHTQWVWKPMRNEDSNVPSVSYGSTTQGTRIYPAVYDKAVPERVLEDVACLISDAADLNLIFLVSDFEVIKPDPFLAVSTEKLLRQGKIFIVEQWDEPGFNDGRSPLVHEKTLGPQTIASR
jgi:hypothetical protein